MLGSTPVQVCPPRPSAHLKGKSTEWYWFSQTLHNTRMPIFTARKRSLGQGNIFRSVCQEFCPHGGGASSRGCFLLGGGGASSRGAWWRPSQDGYCCGRYASYWNTFLSNFILALSLQRNQCSLQFWNIILLHPLISHLMFTSIIWCR